jgi:putative membrane protein
VWALVGIAIVGAVYAWRARTIPQRRRLAFAAGLALLAGAQLLDDARLQWHMAQHLAIGDLAPLLLLAGLTRRAVAPLLALRPVRALRALAHPAVALPLWALDLAVWHLPRLYDAAEAHPALHALEHLCLLACGLAMWAPVVELLPAPPWFGAGLRLGYVLVVRAAMMALGNVFLFSGAALWYGSLADQRAAGGLMMLEGTTVTLAAFAWFFLRLLRESETRERLVEAGESPRRAERAVRYGRAAAP